MSNRQVDVFIIEDDPVLRASLELLISPTGYTTHTFDSAEKFLENLPQVEIGVVIADYMLGNMSGLDLQARMNDMGIAYPVIIVTGHARTEITVTAMKNGAIDFLEKPYSEAELLASVRKAASEAEEALAERQSQDKLHNLINRLSEEERAILNLLLAGCANKQIAKRMEIALRTVERRRHSILKKLEVETVQEAAVLATKAGLTVN